MDRMSESAPTSWQRKQKADGHNKGAIRPYDEEVAWMMPVL